MRSGDRTAALRSRRASGNDSGAERRRAESAAPPEERVAKDEERRKTPRLPTAPAGSAFARLDALGARQGRATMLAFALAMMAAVWALDFLTGSEISFSIFYLIPIAIVAWHLGTRAAILMAVLGAVLWLVAELQGGRLYAHPAVVYWNALVRLGFFVIVSQLLVAVHRLLQVQREASALKSSMMSFVSHEFMNALNTLKLAVALLSDSDPAGATADHAASYAAIDAVLRHLTATAANFLNLERLDGGRLRLDLRPTLVPTLVHEILALMQPLADRKHVEVRFETPSQPVPAKADADALALVLSNLVGNAIKYTPPGGRVTIRVQRTAGATLTVSVADTGIGIDATEQAAVLHGSYRTSAGKSVAGGYGVGLRVCRALLHSHGSMLELESQAGRGSRFSFALPVWEAATDGGRDAADGG